eukprot:scaffold89888_cov52-Attheya_sp.AAC.6
MKFGKTLHDQIIQEWRFYAVDYKALKQTLKAGEASDNQDEFFTLFEQSKMKLDKFYSDKEKWATEYIHVLEERVQKLKETAAAAPNSGDDSSLSSRDSFASVDDAMDKNLEDVISTASPTGAMDLSRHMTRVNSDLKDEYRRVGKSEHFNAFIYAIKSLRTFERELTLLLEFLDLNKTAFSKILKKFDKRTGSAIRQEKLAELEDTHSYLEGNVFTELKESVTKMIDEADSLKPRLPEGWAERKVYTIGCFDLFHRGHQNVLMSLREFGYFIVAGIHDDESYFKLKNKYTIDNLETRMANVKPFVDQLFVIPSTEPLTYVQCMVSEQDIETGSCCYARGDDMLQFPGRPWIESVMPVHFVPRTESCSSTLLRTIYHADSKELRAKAAFAKTRYDGKPIDEDGNVLKLKC